MRQIIGIPEFSFLISTSVDVSELVGVLVEGNDTDVSVFSEGLSEILLGKVLNVSLGEGDGGVDDGGERVGGDGDLLTEVGLLALNLDVVGKVVSEILDDNAAVSDLQLAVDLESVVRLLALLLSLDGLAHLFFEKY